MNRNAKIIETSFTHTILMIKSEANNLRSAKFYAILLASVLLVGLICLSPAISSLTSSFVLRNDGRIGEAGEQPYVLADSGSMVNIQAAVDEVANMGGGDVYIPEGVWDFVPIGTSWTSTHGVQVPNGVRIFGAPTERTSGLPEPNYGMSPNDQVVEWKTVLQVPWDMPTVEEWPAFFYVTGDNVRISDIEFSNYYNIDNSSSQHLCGIWLSGAVDFRVDHCYFNNMAGRAVIAGFSMSSGVIDHCRSVNTHGIPEPLGDSNCLGYGFFVKPNSITSAPLTDFLGIYTSRSVYIEDNYISRWRHACLVDVGGHMVVRHNTFDKNWGYGDIDLHRNWGRAIELYGNEFKNCLNDEPMIHYVAQMTSGGGTAFDNHVDGTYDDGFITITNEAGVTPEWYIWNNTILPGTSPLVSGSSSYYTLSEPAGYSPYQYPHPLTVE